MDDTGMPVEFGDVAPALADQGWRPIPLHRATKEPIEAEWNRLNRGQWTVAELERAATIHYQQACGIALPPENMALDLDIEDQGAADEALHHADDVFGESVLWRVGLAPKSVLLYRADGVRSRKPHPIELYSGSGQVVVFGFHQKAGRPYQWLEKTPLEVAADSDELPLVTQPMVDEFLRRMEPILAGLRSARQRNNGALIGRDAGEYLRELLNRGIRFRSAAERVLQGADAGGRHYAVRAVISAGFNRGMDADAIVALIYRVAPADLVQLVEDDGYLERTLDAFAPVHIQRWRKG